MYIQAKKGKGKSIGRFGERKKSVKYTRRHFVDTAMMIKEMPEPMRSKWAKEWAVRYAADNPRFDRGKFMNACGVN